MLWALVDTVESVQEQMGNVSRGGNSKDKLKANDRDKKENARTETKNAFDK